MQNQTLLPSKGRLIFALVVLAMAAALAAFAFLAPRNLMPSTGTALVGGPFVMVNHKGEAVTEKTYAGKPMLLFFGFTFCPDICPTELQVIGQALEIMGPDGSTIQPLFVTVDPERDTPELIASYISNFNPRFVGLTGTPQQVANMADAYRVFYAKQENSKSPQDYLMDHSSIIYLMGADGQFLKHFSYTTDAKSLAEGLQAALHP